MQKANDRRANWRNAIFFLVALLILVADQLSKTWVRADVRAGQSLFDLGFLQITNIHNTGAAFGIFPHLAPLLAIAAFIGIPVVLACAFLSPRYLPFLDSMRGKVALGLILGGTIGNLADRLRFGYVTDFIDFRIWPTFNLADSAITIGVITVAYCIMRSARAQKH